MHTFENLRLLGDIADGLMKRVFQTLKDGKTVSYNPKLTAARAALAKTESEIEKPLDTLQVGSISGYLRD